ncbi:lipoate--protein ligase [Halobacteriales archaeon SW_7_65_23]|nr:MAG: lipoate--protein ligase [Halobacteriales archaeon SW_7_65_23]
MRVVRGRAATPETDRQRTRDLVDHTAETGERTLRVWTPPPHVAFGRRDANRDGYERARELAAQEYPVIERTVGGRAVVFTGNTVAFVATTPVADSRTGIQERYEDATATMLDALAELGVDAEPGEPDGAFCPGTHSLSADGKIVGLAQRVHRYAAAVSGIVVVRDHGSIAGVLEPVYGALAVPFDPDAVGSIARAGGPVDPVAVCRTIERTLRDGREATVEEVRDT